MNAVDFFPARVKTHPSKMAITHMDHGTWSFEELSIVGRRTQSYMRKLQIGPSDSVVVAVPPSPLLYGMLLGLMGSGVRVIFIEPWLELSKINEVINATKPKAFISSFIGKVWGIRSEAIRKIPHWINSKDILRSPCLENFFIEALPEKHQAFIVFSSGTSGQPKGVVRTHRYMKDVFQLFNKYEEEDFTNPDLVVFPNVALFHLATGRGSIILPNRWKEAPLKKTLEVCQKFSPMTLSAGPAFLKVMNDFNLLKELRSLKRIVVGGALSDCHILQTSFNSLPETTFLHIYGGSEAEPVSLMDARLAVRMSLEEGHFQTICLGKVIPDIKHKLRDGILWVSGPNVSPEYIGAAEHNLGIKERDVNGELWHCMGDRVKEIDGILWYQGREHQKVEDFLLEQKIYTLLQDSKSFLHRKSSGDLVLVGEELKINADKIKNSFPEITSIEESKIIRDMRHRARIDRKKSLPKKLRTK